MLALISIAILLGSGPSDDVLLPLVPFASRDPEDAATNRHVISVDAQGRLSVNGERRTIKELLSWFALKGYPKPKINRNPPRVLVRVDMRAPWLHVQHVVSALQISHIRQVEFGVRTKADERDTERTALEYDTPRGKAGDRANGYFAVQIRGPVSLAASTPGDEAGKKAGGKTPKLLTRDVLNFHAERMVPALWGPPRSATKVEAPLNVRVEWNAMRTYSFRMMVTWLKSNRSLQARAMEFLNRRPRRVLVSATAKVPSGQVIAALGRLRAMGWTELWFFTPTLPRVKPALSAKSLAYPPNNRLLRVSDGLEGTGVPDSSVVSAPSSQDRR